MAALCTSCNSRNKVEIKICEYLVFNAPYQIITFSDQKKYLSQFLVSDTTLAWSDLKNAWIGEIKAAIFL